MHKRVIGARKRGHGAWLGLAALLALQPMAGKAINYTFAGVNNTGNWAVASHWTPAGAPPLAADTAYINANGRVATVDQSGMTANLVYIPLNNGIVNARLTVESGGALTVGDTLSVGGDAGATARGHVLQRGGDVVVAGAGRIKMGGNNSTYTQTAGTVSCKLLYLSRDAAQSATFSVSDSAALTGTTLHVPELGNASFYQEGGSVVANTQIAVGNGAGSNGRYELSGGVLRARVDVGLSGVGTFIQSGGTYIVQNPGGSVHNLYIGGNASGTGTYSLVGGDLLVTNNGVIYVGNDGSGTFLLGNSNSAGRIDTVVPNSSWGELRIARGTAGLFKGWGEVHVNLVYLYPRGRMVADGYGQERTLALTNITHGTPFQPYAGDNTGTGGWYAQNKGKLLLKPQTISAGTFQWGHTSPDYSNYVNSVKLTFAGTTSGSVTGALLALDRGDIPAGLRQPIGVWEFTGGTFGTARLRFRYDHVAAAAVTGRAEADLKVYQYQGDRWINVTEGFANTDNKTIVTKPLTALGQFAVGWGYAGTTILLF